MTLERWEDREAISYDHDILAELVTLRFVEDRQGAFILGPVHPPFDRHRTNRCGRTAAEQPQLVRNGPTAVGPHSKNR